MAEGAAGRVLADQVAQSLAALAAGDDATLVRLITGPPDSLFRPEPRAEPAARPKRKIRIRKRPGWPVSRWEWECTLCQPPRVGATVAWAKTIANVQRHCWRMATHHRHVSVYHGDTLP
jgi:hypothetical protein